jgi:hypothetical protein
MAKISDNTKLEIMTEVAWQIADSNDSIPRAESRHKIVAIAVNIINSCLINDDSEDIDETIANYIQQNNLK